MMPDLLPIATVMLLWILQDVVKALDDPSPVIQTDTGKVRGFWEYTRGKKVEKYLGIPYAKPPLGELRFKRPIKIDPWEDVLDATRLPNACMQMRDDFFGDFMGSTMWNANTEISEDCLYLSVWVPRTDPPYRNKSVILFIYGGSFFSGSHTLDIYNANYLVVENDVIFVAMQYRLGSLGFLTLDTDEAPGNLGLWDQRMALQWVSRNIHHFGGNPHSVTLVSESAGSVSVGLHLLCNICSGFFHRAILQSGAPEVKWSALPKEEMWRRSEKLASLLNCYKEGDHNYMVQCMRGKNASLFPANELYVTSGIIQFPFVPVVDGVFLRQDPEVLMRRGEFSKIPLLLGSNNNEITFFLVYFDKAFNKTLRHNEISRPEYHRLLHLLFEFYPHYPHKLNEFGHDAIQYRYTNWLDADDKIAFRQSLDSAGSDAYFVCAVNRLAMTYSRYDLPVYYYWFDQRWSDNPWPEWMGVLHGDEFWFTFGQALNDTFSFTVEERQLSLTMMKYWSNFAKTGNPNMSPGDEKPVEAWPRFHYNQQMYINLSTKTMASGETWGQGPRTHECAFWDHYLPKLVAETSDISEAERQWKAEFHTWKTRYIVDWKSQFDDFIHNYQQRTAGTKSTTCSHPAPYESKTSNNSSSSLAASSSLLKIMAMTIVTCVLLRHQNNIS